MGSGSFDSVAWTRWDRGPDSPHLSLYGVPVAQDNDKLSALGPAPRPLFTVATLAAYLCVSERTVRAWIAVGKLRSFKLEGSRRIDPADVDDWLASKKEASRGVAA